MCDIERDIVSANVESLLLALRDICRLMSDPDSLGLLLAAFSIDWTLSVVGAGLNPVRIYVPAMVTRIELGSNPVQERFGRPVRVRDVQCI